jgi:hypothetical protein
VKQEIEVLGFLGIPGRPLALPPPSCRRPLTRESAVILYRSGASPCPTAAPTDDVSDKSSCLAASEDHTEPRLAAPLAASEDLARLIALREKGWGIKDKKFFF